MSSTAAHLLQTRLGLSDEELLRVLDEDPLAVITGDLDHKPELPILLTLTEGIDESVLQRWLRRGNIERLLARDFGAFEDAVTELRERGMIIRKRSS
ncbi:MAG TPA: hypothetical protein VNT22_10720 [Baekduia sp.]|nr:hypothetical protein [Baekduia sp.]